MSAPAEQPHAVAVALHAKAIAVVFDLMYPVSAAGHGFAGGYLLSPTSRCSVMQTKGSRHVTPESPDTWPIKTSRALLRILGK